MFAIDLSEQTQENIHKFEKQAGLTDAGYSPHKGLVDETHYHRMADSIHVSCLPIMTSTSDIDLKSFCKG